MPVHLVGYMKEVSIRKCSKVMFVVFTLTDEFFSHISKSHSISSCLQCVYEDCNIVKSLLGHLWSQPGFDSAYHRNLTTFRLLLQWLDWQAWRFSLQIFITSAIMACWLFKAGLFTSFNISENLLIPFALHQNLEYLQQGKKIVELDVFCNIFFHKLYLRRNLVVINKVSKNTFQVLIISYKTRPIKTFVNSRNNIPFITPIAHPQKETKFRLRISDNLNLIVEMKQSKNRFKKTQTLTGMLNDQDTPQVAHTICLCNRLLFYSKCTGFTVCFTYSDISLTMYINQW